MIFICPSCHGEKTGKEAEYLEFRGVCNACVGIPEE